MSPMSICSIRSEDAGIDNIRIMRAIKKDTTPDQFDDIVKPFPSYKIEEGGRCGWNALGRASVEGNPQLIHHIVQIGGSHLLKIGNTFGWTPLYCAANCKDKEDGFLAAKELIRLGADLNLATSTCCGDTTSGDTPSGVTALWAAAEKTQNLKLIELLLMHGAASPPHLTEEKQEIITTLQKEISLEREKRRLFLASYFKPENNESITKKLPQELVREVYDFISPDPEFSIH
jgi:hypothetical protein